MGQYYRAIVRKKNGRMTVYNRYVRRTGKDEYTAAKLTEHSLWLNDFVNAVCLDVYNAKEKYRIAWVGDYAENYLTSLGVLSFNGLDERQIRRLAHQAWDCEGVPVKPTKFTLADKFIVNHTKKEYFDGSLYFRNSCMHSEKYGDWCMHPIPLLTCIGNGMGGGDYLGPTDDSTQERIGAWAWDEISITDDIPANYTEIYPVFKEKGWENE